MGKRCVAAGCNSTYKDGLHLYGFPKDPELRKKWADQVKRTRDKWGPTAHSYLRSKHFEDDCFQPYSKLAESLGVGKVRVLLKRLVQFQLFSRGHQTRGRSVHQNQQQKKRRTAVEKLERSRV